eukprot:m.263214 g.263214  ORF g.263214 m.263214 type:complete len:787 (-) comp15601_c0_seq1:44-2404(-)
MLHDSYTRPLSFPNLLARVTLRDHLSSLLPRHFHFLFTNHKHRWSMCTMRSATSPYYSSGLRGVYSRSPSFCGAWSCMFDFMHLLMCVCVCLAGAVKMAMASPPVLFGTYTFEEMRAIIQRAVRRDLQTTQSSLEQAAACHNPSSGTGCGCERLDHVCNIGGANVTPTHVTKTSMDSHGPATVPQSTDEGEKGHYLVHSEDHDPRHSPDCVHLQNVVCHVQPTAEQWQALQTRQRTHYMNAAQGKSKANGKGKAKGKGNGAVSGPSKTKAKSKSKEKQRGVIDEQSPSVGSGTEGKGAKAPTKAGKVVVPSIPRCDCTLALRHHMHAVQATFRPYLYHDSIHGITNSGNTCFLNVGLQLLMAVPSIKQMLLTADCSPDSMPSTSSPSTPAAQSPQPTAPATPPQPTTLSTGSVWGQKPASAFASSQSTGKTGASSHMPLTDALQKFARQFISWDEKEMLDPRRSVLQLLQRAKPVNAGQVYRAVSRINPRLCDPGHSQQDAEELLSFVLAQVHTELTTAHNPPTAESLARAQAVLLPNYVSPFPQQSSREVDVAAGSKDLDEGDDWVEQTSKTMTSTVVKVASTSSDASALCGGHFRSTLSVRGRHHASATLQPYFVLPADVLPETKTLEDALSRTFAPEQIDDYTTPDGQKTPATKTLTLESVPDTLFIHLKRFRFDPKWGIKKLTHHVAYPKRLILRTEWLGPHLKAKAREEPTTTRYQLVGVVFHKGQTPANGHYTCTLNTPVGWLHYNDKLVTLLESDHVTSSTPLNQAYILCYKRCGPEGL